MGGTYSDARRPDNVVFSQNLEDDLKRRDFTINALAYSPATEKLVDLYNGIDDLKQGIIRAVGDPKERFSEDALRILRAIRITAELNFDIEPATKDAMAQFASKLSLISKERIRDEFLRIVNSPRPMKGLLLANVLEILSFILPELQEGIGVDQNQAHSFTVFEHNVRSLQHAADKDWPQIVRLAALLHDIGKPRVRQWSDQKKDWTFHGHDVVGAKIAKKALENLKFSRETIDTIEKLVRWHMFFSDPEKVTLSAVRRLVRNVRPENMDSLIKLRICDRIGTGRPKEQPFRFRKYQAMIEQALRDPISVSMLAINGAKVMDVTREKPGPRIGWILHGLLEEVLDDPQKNTTEYLDQEVIALSKLSDEELQAKGQEGKERKNEIEQGKIKDIQEKYCVN